MTSFDRREEALEAKFVHDGERAFKARARALRMLIVGRRKARRDRKSRRKLRANSNRGRYRHARCRVQQTRY
jgi:hypothetical protein